MAEQWGLEKPGKPADGQQSGRARRGGLSTGLPPEKARVAHRGIVWIHLSAIMVWVFVAMVFGIILATGRSVPSVVVFACLGAAAGHGLFLAVHLYYEAAARRRAATQAAKAGQPAPPVAGGTGAAPGQK